MTLKLHSKMIINQGVSSRFDITRVHLIRLLANPRSELLVERGFILLSKKTYLKLLNGSISKRATSYQEHPTTVSSEMHWKLTFQAIQSIFRPLEMLSNRRYKICISPVILGELESCRNYKRFRIIISPRGA